MIPTRMRLQKENRYYSGPKSDHFDGTLFFNPDGMNPPGFLDFAKLQFAHKRTLWPKQVESKLIPHKPDAKVEGKGMRVTMIGHASLLIQVAGVNILTDPVFSDRVSPFDSIGPKRVCPAAIAFEDLPKIDAVLITHNHYDHLSQDCLKRLQADHAPRMITPLGNDTVIHQKVPDASVTVLDWGNQAPLPGGIRVFAEPCHHWSARGVMDRRMALWSAFVLETPAGRIYHIGDTGFQDGRNYKAAAEKYGSFRLANLPIGAYEPRFFLKNEHQDPVEAVKGFELCNAAYAAGHHFGTFQLTDEGIDAPAKLLKAALQDAGIDEDRFRPLEPGEVFDVPETD